MNGMREPAASAPAGPGTALGVSICGVESLEASLGYYRDLIGLDVVDRGVWAGSGFERHWGLPVGSSARTALLGFGESPVGRVLLLEFDAFHRTRVRENYERAFYGLFNLNFYCEDIPEAVAELEERGYDVWSDPLTYDVSSQAGRPTEVLYDGPDGVIINLVQPAGGGDTAVGEMKAYLDRRGVTARGFTEVATSSHRVKDRRAAFEFHRSVLGQEVFIDATLGSGASNQLWALPEEARTRATFMRGAHPFGKVVLSRPLNYRPPDFVPRAVAPNIGYLAMVFPVADLGAALAAANLGEGGLIEGPVDLTIPGVGRRTTAVVRAPGSGARYELMEDEIPLP